MGVRCPPFALQATRGRQVSGVRFQVSGRGGEIYLYETSFVVAGFIPAY